MQIAAVVPLPLRAAKLTRSDVDALRREFGGSIQYIERDVQLSITSGPQPDWLHSDVVPPQARPQQRRHLQSEQRRSQRPRRAAIGKRRRLPQQQERDPSWNLDRIDQRSLPLDHLYNYDATGTGVNV